MGLEQYSFCPPHNTIVWIHASIDEVDSAMKTSIKLCEYDDVLSARNIYSLLCLTSWKNGYYSVCSKAFVKVIIQYVVLL